MFWNSFGQERTLPLGITGSSLIVRSSRRDLAEPQDWPWRVLKRDHGPGGKDMKQVIGLLLLVPGCGIRNAVDHARASAIALEALSDWLKKSNRCASN